MDLRFGAQKIVHNELFRFIFDCWLNDLNSFPSIFYFQMKTTNIFLHVNSIVILLDFKLCIDLCQSFELQMIKTLNFRVILYLLLCYFNIVFHRCFDTFFVAQITKTFIYHFCQNIVVLSYLIFYLLTRFYNAFISQILCFYLIKLCHHLTFVSSNLNRRGNRRILVM